MPMPPGVIPLEELLGVDLVARVDRLAAQRGITRDELLERLSLVGLAALEARSGAPAWAANDRAPESGRRPFTR